MITYDDFAKLDIRLGTILTADKVPETDKLIRIEVDLGEEEPRQLVAGIAEHIEDISSLVGKQLPILSNLEPRTIKGIESRGMILAASAELLLEGHEGPALTLLHPAHPLPNGSKIR